MHTVTIPAKGSDLRRYPKGNVYQGFGESPDLYKPLGISGHNGIDIAMREGTPILGTTGVICEVKDEPSGYGKHIRILTDPDESGDYLELTYGHLKDIFVPLGLRVTNGQVIGTMGNTGFVVSGSTPYWGNAPARRGVHLHFGVRECSVKDTGWITTYSTGKTAFIKNYNNGNRGSVDPMIHLKKNLEEQIVFLTRIKSLLEKVVALLR